MLIRCVLVAVFSTLATASLAQADPIQATYEVQIWSRYSYANDVFELYSAPPFKVTLSFDSAVTRVSDFMPYGVYEQYGAPTFSDIPLDAPTRPSDFPSDQTTRYTMNEWYLDNATTGPSGPYGHFAIAQTITTSTSAAGEYFTGVELALYIHGFPAPGPLSATDFVDFLGRPTPLTVGGGVTRWEELNFSAWSRYTTEAGIDPHSYAYFGAAHSVVPEPASLLLVGSGVAAVAASSRRRKRTR